MSSVPHVYQAINAVMRDIAVEGIAKSRKNQEQGFRFRGIEDALNTLAPLLVKHKLLILPRFVKQNNVERVTKSGGRIGDTYIEGEFDLVSAVDGSKHTIRTHGQGMDSGDKATNKAMASAMKYAVFFGFCVPTEGVLDDGDYDSHEIQPETRQQEQSADDLEQEQRKPVKQQARTDAEKAHARAPATERAREASADYTPVTLPPDEDQETTAWRAENVWPLLIGDIRKAPEEKTLKAAFSRAYRWAQALPMPSVSKNLLANAIECYEQRKAALGLKPESAK